MGWFTEFIEGVKEFALDVGQANLDVQSHHQAQHSAPNEVNNAHRAEETQRSVRDLSEVSLSAARQVGQDIHQAASRPAEATVAQAAKQQTSPIRR